jgi:hypothetical protein
MGESGDNDYYRVNVESPELLRFGILGETTCKPQNY